MIQPPEPPLSDGDILLRPFGEADVPAVVAACRDPEIQRWIPVPSPYTEQDAHEYIQRVTDGWAQGSLASFAIVALPGREIVGSIGVRPLNTTIERSIGQIGYWVAPQARGRGTASRALRLLSDWAFAACGFARLQLLTEPENVASQRVAEHAGFVREGVLRSYLDLRGSRRDGVMFGLLPGA